MTTCEHCGADAVDAQGRCHACGWSVGDSESSPSLGETRAADAATASTQAAWAANAPEGVTYTERPDDYAPYGVSSQPSGGGRQTAGAGATSRFCGACGARITGSEAFCGQCGTPIGATSGGHLGTVLSAPVHPTMRGGQTGWGAPQGDEPTEAFVAPAGRGLSSNPYGNAYTPMGYGAQQQERRDSSRSVRIFFGVACLIGSLASAAGAIILVLSGSQH